MLVVPRAVQDSRYKRVNALGVAQRILDAKGFNSCLQSDSISDQNFKIFFVRKPAVSAKLGIIVSKKKLFRAVDRNRAKRVIKETFRLHEIRSTPVDLVVMVRRAIPASGRAQRDGLVKLFSQLKAQCAES